MITEKFKELFDFGSKSNVKAGDGLDEGNFPFYTSSSILKKRIDKAQYFDDALIFGTGGSASIHFAGEPFATSTDCIVAITKHEDLNAKFVYYYLFGNIHLLERGFKGAGLKHISKKYIENLDIPILPIETQNKIVAVLDKANSLINKRESAIALINSFLKSYFWDLFGDLGVNKKGWPIYLLVDLCKKKDDIRCGPFGTQLKNSEFTTEGIPLWGIRHINSDFKIKTEEYVSKDKAKQLSNYNLIYRDIVMTRKGTVGNCHVYPNTIEEGIMHSDVLRIRVDEELINPFFLAYQFKYNEVLQWQINRVSSGVVMAGINVSKLKSITIPVPEKTLQDKFENILQRTDKIKERLANQNITDLFNSLIQKVFNGELNFNIDLELDSLIKEIDLQKKENDLSKIVADFAYLQRLIDKLNSQEFKERELYDKAKHAVFQLLKEDVKIIQEYDENSNCLKLAMK